MECAELAALRREATVLFKDFALRRRRAREHAAASSGQARIVSALVRHGDFESYLQRRLAKSAARIEAHIATHGCQV
jgi:predicted phage gp36 major capsid-like protein